MGDSSKALLAGSVPDLSLDCAGLDAECLGGELNSDGGLGLLCELVGGESG